MRAAVDGPYCAIHDAAHPPCDPATGVQPRPCAKWAEYRPDRWRLSAGPMFEAQIDRGVGAGRYVWRIADGRGGIDVDRWVASLDAAKLAAEDSLRAIAAEILRAVGA